MRVTKIEIDDQDAADILTDAIETHAIDYWALNRGELITIERDDKFDGCIVKAIITTDREEGEAHEAEIFTVTLDSIKEAVKLVFASKPDEWKGLKSALIEGDTDSDDDDAILQIACFKEVIYG